MSQLKKYLRAPSRFIELPDNFEKWVSQKYQIEDPLSLAKAIQWMSDFYIQYPDKVTPWSEELCQKSQLHYYLPLNFLRTQAVMLEGEKNHFFEGLDEIIDFGCGLGAGSLPFLLHNSERWKRACFIEHSTEAMRLHKKIISDLKIQGTFQWWNRWKEREQDYTRTLGIFSYSLTELSEFPQWAENFGALIILEPGTHQDGRRLLKLRQELLQKGFYVWAPCLHQGECPLLKETKSDWCHDRLYWQPPAWFQSVEAHLPIKNQDLTMSYLLLKKAQPLQTTNEVRVTGDLLFEKGKAKQMVCRSEEREFLVWLKRHGTPTKLKRGQRVKLPDKIDKKGSEIRVLTEHNFD